MGRAENRRGERTRSVQEAGMLVSLKSCLGHTKMPKLCVFGKVWHFVLPQASKTESYLAKCLWLKPEFGQLIYHFKEQTVFKIWAISIFLFGVIVNSLKAFSEKQNDQIAELPLPL